MSTLIASMSTDEVMPRERRAFWSDWLNRMFSGLLQLDFYGSTDVEVRMSSMSAGEVTLSRIDGSRHRVQRSPAMAHRRDESYIVLVPMFGRACLEQHGRRAWLSPGQWAIYDANEDFLVENPSHVEHLIARFPRSPRLEQGLKLSELCARPMGTEGSVSRIALETIRHAERELHAMDARSTDVVGDLLIECVRLSLLDLTGQCTSTTRREILRDRIKRYIAQNLGDPQLCGDIIARALGVSRRQLYNAFAEEPEGVAGFVMARRVEACCVALGDVRLAGQSITDIALASGFSNLSHFSRVFRARTGLSPSAFRETQAALRGR